MAALTITVNGRTHTLDVPPDTPLLWVLRDELKLKGTKYSCGIAACGACTVNVEGAPTRSCITPVSAVANRHITTIEGLGAAGLNALQRAWLEEEVPQCGYCQPGQLMQAAALLAGNPDPSDGQIDAWMSSNLCRCGTYLRIRKAIRRAAREVSHG